MNLKNLKIEFLKAKNGENTCTLNGKYFHSAYNPSREAQAFCNSMEVSYKPSCIIIIEPALSYCANFLKEKFSLATLIAIRFIKDFASTDFLWDKVFYFEENKNFCQELYNYLGEEKLLSSIILNWNASTNIFCCETENLWAEIKKAMLLARDVLSTREHFSKRWFFNSINFCKYSKNFSLIQNIEKDILITASGPSLKTSIKKIKERRNKFFLIALSSSLSVLLYNKITPDMVLSTDGGFWATKHLELTKDEFSQLKNTVFALTDEANCPKQIWQKNKIFPLFYENSFGEKLLKRLNIPAKTALRNGTVSGTAAFLALSLTKKNIYFCGLDLATSDGFQHTQPNRLETRSQNKDKKLNSKEKRQTTSRFNSEGSLKIYRNWFTSQTSFFDNRIFRLSDYYDFKAPLFPIKDKNWEEVEFSSFTEKKIETVEFQNNSTPGEIYLHTKEILKDKNILKELFPLETLLINRELSQQKITENTEKLNKKIETILQKCRKMTDV